MAAQSEKIQTAIAKVSDQPGKYVLNTHWHGDHTGGNENFGTNGAVTVSHENVRKRLTTARFMNTFSRKVPTAPDTALSVRTFSDDARFHFNDTERCSVQLPKANSNGDSGVLLRPLFDVG